jgi:hypothetical protein
MQLAYTSQAEPANNNLSLYIRYKQSEWHYFQHHCSDKWPMTDRTISISEQAARTLLRIAQQIQMPSAQGKVLLGQAQMELEVALAMQEPEVEKELAAAG